MIDNASATKPTQAQEQGLRLSNLEFAYDDYRVSFSMCAAQGEIVALVGPSGAGKSTLLHMVAGLITPRSGELHFGGQQLLSLAPFERPISMLFQSHNLFEHLTVAQNIGLGIHPGLKLTAKQQQAVTDAAIEVGLSNKLHCKPDELSGGQKQRVALARCCVSNQSLWLLDEPFSALDPQLRQEMLTLVKRLACEHGVSVVMVTHQLSDALSIASRFAFVFEGRIDAQGSIDALIDLSNGKGDADSTALAAFVDASA